MKKQAILLIHFGTTHDDTREKTIDVFRKKVESLFPDCDIFEAFTSRMIIKRLKARGIYRKNPLELLEELKEQGDRKSTRLNSSHANISYAVFCLKKKKRSSNTSTS